MRLIVQRVAGAISVSTQYGTVVGTLRSSTELLAAGEDARRDAAAAVYGGDLGS
eukprot:COSAG02_NODE_48293_length_334_cov_4.387234_1_plen_53_part_10